MVRDRVAAGQRVGVYKPVASGCRVEGNAVIAGDAEVLWHAARCPRTLEDVCPQRFVAAMAPSLAAVAEGGAVDEEKLIGGLDVWGEYDVTIVEGAGGLFSPISDRWLNVDLIAALAVDRVVLVASNRLGVAHQVLVCLAAAEARGVNIDQVVLNPVSPDETSEINADLILRFTEVEVVDYRTGASPRPVGVRNHDRISPLPPQAGG